MKLEMTESNDGSVAPPNGNGKVSTAELYKALYNLDQGLSRRFTTVLDAINLGREDLDEHKARPHVVDNKKVAAAAGGGILGVITIAATILAKLLGVGV